MGIDKRYYANAAREVADGTIDSDLYVKALALADGEERKARAIYVGLRAEELQSDARKTAVANALGGAAGLTVGTAQAAGMLARHFPFRKLFALIFILGSTVISFLISAYVADQIMIEMRYDRKYPVNILVALLACGTSALVVGWVATKLFWPHEYPSGD